MSSKWITRRRDTRTSCALDIFTAKSSFERNGDLSKKLLGGVGQAIEFILSSPAEAADMYYDYTKEKRSALMDDIIKATISCFERKVSSTFESQLPILRFFNDIGISDLSEKDFRLAFVS